MKIVALDDEKLAREMLMETIKEAYPDAEIAEFEESDTLLRYIEQNECDVAFIDIHIIGMTGLELAEKYRTEKI